ncbi:allophanate hydrolase [Flavobacteriales bacterium 34_180_T64]|nr:allophanate hydrolase [Flavobacteriales bacterium 34_180_T64]
MVEITKSGFYSTIQDLGRYGFQSIGVPSSGVMDIQSANFANLLIGNSENDAVIEMTATGSTLLFHVDTTICITGADMSPLKNLVSLKNNTPTLIKSGDVISFGKRSGGFRCYLAVLGGFKTELVMNSRSMYNNVTAQHKLKKGDRLEVLKINSDRSYKNATLKFDTSLFNENYIDVFKGPEFDLLSESQQNLICSNEFTISDANNRMAYQLIQKISNELDAIITSLVLPGTVQLTPAGILIVLMRDCQTTGGYPRVLQLKESAINILAQKSTSQRFLFKLIG